MNTGVFSLGPERRLRVSWEFRRFFNQSEVFRMRECIVYRIPNSLGHFRLGVTLKARGTSVDRNRVKRAVREGFRTRADRLGSFDYNVVIPASRKMVFPYPRRLAECLNREIQNVFPAR